MRKNWLLLYAAVLLLLTISAGDMVAQPLLDDFSAGRQYVIAFPDTSANVQFPLYQDIRFGDRFIVQMYSPVATSVLMRSGDGRISRRFPLTAGLFLAIDLADPLYSDFTPPAVSAVGTVASNTFRLDADSPILVTCFVMTRTGAEAWSPLPVEAWGTNYFAAMVPGDIIYDIALTNNRLVKKPRPAESKILVVAAYDSTIVSLYPTGRINPSFPYTVRLDAGQAFQFQSFVDTALTSSSLQTDLAGSRLIASRPIGVITGNSRAPVADDLAGQLKNSFKNLYFEALAPVDEHGREFVYMPTWDLRRTQFKRSAEYARVYGTSQGTTTGVRRLTTGAADTFMVAEGTVRQLEFDRSSPAVRITTNRPAQAMMHSSAVVTSSGTSFDSWSSSMTELVPREQWTSFAPISVPIDLAGMEHFVNVVTSISAMESIYRDNGELFPFNQGVIPGTDLVWGTIQIPASAPITIEGRDGARFSAVSYGLSKGNEQSGTVRNTPYYRETIALAYSHAVAPRRRALSGGDSIRIDSTVDCNGIRLTLRSVLSSPVGLRTITLESAVNARIGSIAPAVWVNASLVTIDVRPIDPTRDASAVVLVEDRSGKKWRIRFDRKAEKLELAPVAGLDLGELMVGESRRGDIMITNPTAVAVRIRSIALASGNPDFTIVSSLPTLPALLAPGESLQVTIEGMPLASPARSVDSLRIELDCTRWSTPLRLESVEPCIEVGDLRFDTIPLRQTRSLPLTICNSGRGRLTFTPLNGDSIIIWEDRSFTVGSAYQTMLRSADLGPGECITIQVLFQSAQAGSFRSVARIGSSAPRCIDSSVWTAVAGGTTGVREEKEPGGLRLVSTTGNRQELRIDFSHASRERITIDIVDLAGRERLRYDAGEREPGERSLTLPVDLPAGLYLVRLTGNSGSITGWYRMVE